jgi:hypothetical protein
MTAKIYIFADYQRKRALFAEPHTLCGASSSGDQAVKELLESRRAHATTRLLKSDCGCANGQARWFQ